MEHRQYKNPPIEEALCEFHFGASEDWGPTLPGRFYEKISEKYTGKPRQQKVFQANVQMGPSVPENPFTVKEGLGKVQFPDEKEEHLVAIGPNELSVHALRPYKGWGADFESRVEEAYEAYRSTTEPEGLRRLGVRYVNKIVIPQERPDLNKYFTSVPHLPEVLPHTVRNLLNRSELLYEEEERTRLVMTFASTDAPEGSSAFILDLDVIRTWEESYLDAKDALHHIQELKDKENDAFEALITDNSRALFDS